MTSFLVILFAISLVYLAFTERVKRLITALVFQGFLLFGIAYFKLSNIEPSYLLFILFETLVVKSIATPLFLNYVRRRNALDRLSESKVPAFVSVLVVTGAILFGFILSNALREIHIQTIFFAVAISAVISGLYFVISHLNVFTHLVGYLVIENGIFLLSLAVGEKMPILVNNAILLDIFISVLVLGVFINRVGNTFQNISVDELSKLKD